jgi:hypothetical protein
VRAVDAASALVGALILAASLGPETSWDGFEYHLPLAAAWSEGPIRAIPGLLDAEFRAAVDLLYVPAVTSGFPDAAAFVSACFALAVAALLRAEASRRASPGAGALAGLFALLVPLTVDLAATTYVDLAVATYGFAGLLLADRWNRGASPRALIAAAWLLGFALNAKLHAALLCPAVLVLVLLGGRPPPAALVARCVGLVAALTAPWLLKVALTTGNPLFPLFGEWLGTGPTDARNLELRRLRLAANYDAPRTPAGFLQYLLSLGFGRNLHVSGLAGPLPLALGPLALRGASRAGLALAFVLAVLLVLQFATMPALRFGAPLVPFAGLAAAVGGARLARSGRAARGVLGVALALLAVHHATVLALRYLPRVAALRDPQAYERRMFPDQDALRRTVADATPVVGIPMGAVSWMPKPVYNLLWERNGELYFVAGGTPPDPAFELLARRGVRSLVLDVETPLPEDGTLGHPIVDVWLRDGRARLRRGREPLPARGTRVWVVVDLAQAEGGSP